MKIEERIEKEIKANITVLMLDIVIPNCYDELSSIFGIYENNQFKPAMEYLVVSEWLSRQLFANNQPVIKFKNLYIWGRLGTGYSLTDEEILIDIFGGQN